MLAGVRRAVPAIAAAPLLVAIAGSAFAQGSLLAEAAEALRAQGIYVDETRAGDLSADEVDALRSAIASADVGQVYIAVLPEEVLAEAGNDPDTAVAVLSEQVGRSGTY